MGSSAVTSMSHPCPLRTPSRPHFRKANPTQAQLHRGVLDPPLRRAKASPSGPPPVFSTINTKRVSPAQQKGIFALSNNIKPSKIKSQNSRMLPKASLPKDHKALPHPEVLTSPPNCCSSPQTRLTPQNEIFHALSKENNCSASGLARRGGEVTRGTRTEPYQRDHQQAREVPGPRFVSGWVRVW